MKKSLVFKIVLASTMAALGIVLEKFSIPLGGGAFKFTFYGLPLLFTGIMFGPFVGGLAGIVVGFVSQLTSQWGLSETTPLWMLAPIIWGLLSGVMARVFNKKVEGYSVLGIILTVVITSVAATTINSIVISLDGLIMGYVVEQTVVTILVRFAISLGLCVPYSLILYFICNRLKHLSWKSEENL